MTKLRLVIRWMPGTKKAGSLEVRNGRLAGCRALRGAAYNGSVLEISEDDEALIELELEISDVHYGEKAAIVRWNSTEDGFAFMPSALISEECICVPDFGVAIANSESALQDGEAITVAEVLDGGDFPRGREVGWDVWASRNNTAVVPTVLGLSRDQRFFVLDLEGAAVKAAMDLTVSSVTYDLARSSTADGRRVRSLEEDYLPILHSRETCGDIVIEDTFFASFADRPLTIENLKGTPLLSSHFHARGSTFSPAAKEALDLEMESFRHEGEVVLYIRTRLTNFGSIPLIVAQHLPKAVTVYEGEDGMPLKNPERLDSDGVLWFQGRPLSLHYVNGKIARSIQPSLLLASGGSLVIDSILSHSVLGLTEETRRQPIFWEEKLKEARGFWKERASGASEAMIPEKRLSDFWKAGLLHLELVTLGLEKGGALLAKTGVYTAIGSESIPIVEFYDSLGFHDTARRCLDAFFDLQHDSGRINLFGRYDIETGGILFLSGRHFSYTNDTSWVAQRAKQFKSAADYLLEQRQLGNRASDNYGLMSGTCADPLDKTTAFMLNAFNAAGLAAVADLLDAIEDPAAQKYRKEAESYREILRAAFKKSFAMGPLLPTATGRWVPSCAPWVEGIGPQILGLKGENCFSHWTYLVFDVLLGPLYGVSLGVLEAEELFTDWLLEVNHVHYNRACVGESQPYYSRHPEVHLLRGERELFLNAFYSGLSSIADRETFTFWEHFHKVSPHKTHEEGWALMQLRRMLWFEVGNDLRLLAGIPEAWLDPGQTVGVNRGWSYFGQFSFLVRRSEDGRSIELRWNPNFHSPPGKVLLHLPGVPTTQLPDGMTAAGPGWIEILNSGQNLSKRIELVEEGVCA